MREAPINFCVRGYNRHPNFGTSFPRLDPELTSDDVRYWSAFGIKADTRGTALFFRKAEELLRRLYSKPCEFEVQEVNRCEQYCSEMHGVEDHYA